MCVVLSCFIVYILAIHLGDNVVLFYLFFCCCFVFLSVVAVVYKCICGREMHLHMVNQSAASCVVATEGSCIVSAVFV